MDIKDMNITQINHKAASIFDHITDAEIRQNHWPDCEAFLRVLESDSRKGAQKIAASYRKALAMRINEIYRIESLINFDLGYQAGFLAGVDEVGRGPLAGPVVASCVIMDLSKPIMGIDDSKKLSKQKREELYDQIIVNSLYCAIGQADHNLIDRVNILNATFIAMNFAISHINQELKPQDKSIDLILVDGNQKIREQITPQKTITKGDSKSYSIACASILAKVYRDRLMAQMDEKYPGYDFASNSGYGSESHRIAIKNQGLCPIHRKTFCTNLG